MSQKILLYRIKADSPEFACKKAKELLIPEAEVNLGLSNEEQIVLAQVLMTLNELVGIDEFLEAKGYDENPRFEKLIHLDVLEGENLEVLKQNLEDIKSKTLAENLNWTLDSDWRNNKFSFMNIRGETLDAIMRYLEKDIPNLEEIIIDYLDLPILSKKTIKDIRRTNFFKSDEFEGNIFNCLFQIFDHELETDTNLLKMREELEKINCSMSANEILGTHHDREYSEQNLNYDGSINISDLEILGCLSEDNESYLCGDDDYPSSFTIEELNKRYDNDPKDRAIWNPESESYEDIENFNVLTDLDDDIDIDYDGHFHPLEELNYEGEKGKIYIVFGAMYDYWK